MNPAKPTPRLRIQLFPRAESAVRSGHPWVFADSVKGQNREGTAGELAVMYDRKDRFLAVGLYDPASPIRVRILHCGKPATIDRTWWLDKTRAALASRDGTVLNERTDGARCINGESEGFPGLVADLYSGTLVVKLYSASWLAHWEIVEDVLREVFSPEHLVLRMSRNVMTEAGSKWDLREGYRGEPGDDIVVFRENGIRFESAVLRGQKTGFFLDQRDNRARVEALAGGRSVLNVFSFSGGFSLYAARGGASRVTDLDISAHALESAARNFKLNADEPRIAVVPHEAVQADAFAWIEEAPADRSYDLIVVDPPSLAKRERERDGAIRAYHRLNAKAIERLRPGGILVAASCSAHVPAVDFIGLVRELARKSGRKWSEQWTSAHAADHPASFPEAEYLKAICLKID
ncbi:class I SAM-dependent rRNA methyltransferase [Luteolibacter marinus]|uniref:class I SAM-dependent rRNA methyltransferase n=1 Tax=Luteolibacter marinus TaxID=2776705 RepID=UPI001866148B|nr:class I SAM-dependent rRNA methyltransferase [Luteolibacter marinus]